MLALVDLVLDEEVVELVILIALLCLFEEFNDLEFFLHFLLGLLLAGADEVFLVVLKHFLLLLQVLDQAQFGCVPVPVHLELERDADVLLL